MRGSVLAGILLACLPRAAALNPALDISQYGHRSWKISDGFAKGGIHSITQTPDGYLWLGTEFGLLRFDGVRNTAWPHDRELPSTRINKLLTARDGTLWIGTSKGLASWKGDKLTLYPELAGHAVFALLENHEGTVWAGGFGSPTARLCAIQKEKVQCYGEDGSFGSTIFSLCESGGYLWAATRSGMWRWKPDPPQRYPLPESGFYTLIEGDNSALWVAARGGIRQFVDGRFTPYPLPKGGPLNPEKLLRDRDGNLWFGTREQGLWHLHQGRMDALRAADGLSGDLVSSLIEDREGNIWVATYDGLDCFRDLAVSTISVRQGLSGLVTAVLAARDGSVWISSRGLDRWNNGEITTYRRRGVRPGMGSDPQRRARVVRDDGLPDDAPETLFQDNRGRIWVATRQGVTYFEDGRFVGLGSMSNMMVHSIAQDSAGDLWINDQTRGLLHLHDGRLIEEVTSARLGRNDAVAVLANDERQGGLWLGFYRGGVAHLKDGRIHESYGAGTGLGEARVNDFRFDRHGALWAAAENGLSRLQDGRIATLTSDNGLPCDSALWSMEDNARSVWVKMACGLVNVPVSEVNAWTADPKHKLRLSIFDSSDGVRNVALGSGFSPHVAKTGDGKLWFSNQDGVGVVDPLHLPINKLPPPVHIEQIIADRNDVTGRSRLPALVRDLEIDYTALTFVAPEKVRFRYLLEGYDREWHEAGNRRQAFYTNLPPRQYRFRLTACNNSGVWNEAGASLEFAIAPAYYQTTWFRLAWAAAFLALLGLLYYLRVQYLKRQFNMRVEARVSERTRIARDLHDTLLQSFQGVLLQFHSLTYLLPDRPAEALKKLEAAIEQARGAVTEGRDAVQGLRTSTVLTNDLARSIRIVAEELVSQRGGRDCPEFRLDVGGRTRDLAPVVRDDVHRIACEAVRNAFVHAQARQIHVEILYERREFRLLVRDDGKGIDADVLAQGGRGGHHGLPGMQERAELVQGKLSVWSQLGSGTGIELSIPASRAYLKAAGRPASSTGANG